MIGRQCRFHKSDFPDESHRQCNIPLPESQNDVPASEVIAAAGLPFGEIQICRSGLVHQRRSPDTFWITYPHGPKFNRAKIRAKPSRALAPAFDATPFFDPANAVFVAAARDYARKRAS